MLLKTVKPPIYLKKYKILPFAPKRGKEYNRPALTVFYSKLCTCTSISRSVRPWPEANQKSLIMRSISQIKTIHGLWEWGKETGRSYFICCSSLCSFKQRQKVNWQDLVFNTSYFQWKELSNSVLFSVLHEEDQQKNPNAKGTQHSWRQDGQNSLATPWQANTAPQCNSKLIFGCINYQIENMIQVS